ALPAERRHARQRSLRLAPLGALRLEPLRVRQPGNISPVGEPARVREAARAQEILGALPEPGADVAIRRCWRAGYVHLRLRVVHRVADDDRVGATARQDLLQQVALLLGVVARDAG